MEYRFGPFQLDPDERRLLRDGSVVSITPKAFDLLIALVEHPGRLVEKDVLMKRIWPEAVVEEANLANNVSLLRKILAERNEQVQYIETVPRRGYRFLVDVVEHREEAPSVPPLAPLAVGAGSPRRFRAALTIAATAVVVAMAAIVLLVFLRPRTGPDTEPGVLLRFPIAAPRGTLLPPLAQPISPALSPDGAYLVFRVLQDGAPMLALRATADVESQTLAGTQGGMFPFWSPDGRTIGFFADGKLKRIDRSGGAAQILCDAAMGAGGTWNRHGEILFAPTMAGPLYKVAAGGGAPLPATTLHAGEMAHQHPQFLPDGRSYIYFSPPDGIYFGSLDATAPVRVLTSRSQARYAPSGYLLFVKDRALVAQSFDARHGRLTGDPILVADGVPAGGPPVGGRPAGGGAFAVSENGVLAYRTVSPVQPKLAWFDRAGRNIEPVDLPSFARFSDVELSPDGKRIALAHGTRPSAEDVWVVDLVTHQTTQVTFDPSADRRPIWSADGQWLAFASARADAPGLYRKMWNGDQPEELLLRDGDQPGWPSDWVSSGIVYEQPQSVAKAEARMLPLDNSRSAHRLVDRPVSQPDAKVSPDAKWVAYTWSEPGERPEVFVQSTSTPGGAQWRISTGGGSFPRWRSNGRELFYLSADGGLMAVPVEVEARQLHPGVPQRLFATALNGVPESLRSFGVSQDGQRFLLSTVDEAQPAQSLVVMSNWQHVFQR
jgi:DNA-binding winged helix-turn-helix (wHTH) protein